MTTDATIRVDHAALDQAAADMAHTVRAIAARLDDLESELAPLRGGWSGQAREAYDVAKRQWDAAMLEMSALLDEAGRAVSRSNAEYRARDLAGAARFGAGG